MRQVLFFSSLLFVVACGGGAEVAEVPAKTVEKVVKKVEKEAASPAKSADLGAAVFQKNCASCHGEGGRGDGPAGASLKPPAADLVGPRAAHLRGIPRKTIIAEGRPGTAMIAWKEVLSPEELTAVYGFVHTLKHGAGAPECGGGEGECGGDCGCGGGGGEGHKGHKGHKGHGGR